MTDQPSETSTLNHAQDVERQLIWHVAGQYEHLLNLGELWRYRELLRMLSIRDLKVQYRQAYVGIAWAMLQPLVTMAIFTLLFGLLGRTPADESVPYPIVAFCGLLPWFLFAGSVTKASACLVTNQNLITKVYFPRAALPIAAIVTSFVDFLVGLALLILMMLWYQIVPPVQILVLPVFILMTLLAAASLSLWLSAANGLYRDIGYIVPFLMQIGFYFSPVIYESGSLIPGRWQFLYQFNPMVGIIEGIRWSLLGHAAPPLQAIVISFIGLVLLTLGGMAYFRRVERHIADRI
ncbi:MAG: ABC transporter permease [Planctomycetaceae bacterium]|nr:ABC transporter permease [Planctomycetaceae bacterium]